MAMTTTRGRLTRQADRFLLAREFIVDHRLEGCRVPQTEERGVAKRDPVFDGRVGRECRG